MSNISELRERIAELETRVAIVEKLLLDLTEAKGIQDFHSEQHHIGEVRTPIGFKTKKRKK